MKMQSVGFKADSKLEAFINQKISKLQKFNDNITGCEVFLNLEKSETLENKVVEVKMGIPGQELFAKKQCKTFEEATDMVADALRTQILKHKEKLQAK
ncbi:MAG: ribosome hibernation-promoting factor, HPF/YfiA family [Marinifilaceae bacterium]